MAYQQQQYARGPAAEYEEYDEAGPSMDPSQLSNPDAVPDVIRTFVAFLYRNIREKNVVEIHNMYDSSFKQLSQRFFPTSPWPTVDAIAPFVEHDHVFGLLYRELYFRDVFARLSPTLQQRCESWENYCTLFQVFLHGNLNMQLPNQWLWDMIDEFVYQFQSFCQFRSRTKSRTEEEVQQLKECSQVWNVLGVCNYLQAIIDKSGIVYVLMDDSEGGAADVFYQTEGYDLTPGGTGGGSNVLRTLGYFAIVGLLRVHCLLGDYHTALQRMSAIDLGRPGVYQRIIGCHISVMYCYGFASMRLRRYVDAIKAFNQILLTLGKMRQYLEASPQFQQIMIRNEQLYALLAICLALCPNGKLVEESVNAQLREKHAEKIQRMQRGDLAVFDELFTLACPKFVTPSPPDFSKPLVNYNQNAYRVQLKLFLADVKSHIQLPTLRSALALYSSISLPRLANHLDTTEDALRTALESYAHKNYVADLDGTVTSNADLHFVVDDDVVRVINQKPKRNFGEYFIRHIVRLDEIVTELDAVKME